LRAQGKLNGTTVEGRAVLRNGHPFCNFGAGYSEEPLQWTDDPCAVDPSDGRQFICQIDERLAPGGSLYHRQ
jgi:hypothetical protein